MKNAALLLLFLFITFSCKESIETKFEKDGVSLTCPQGWKITDQENFDDEGYYLSIEKDGFDSSGLFSITWVNINLDLDE